MMRNRSWPIVVVAMLATAGERVTAQPSTVILVRHAERAATPANDPGLTPEGERRAKDLAAVLAHARVNDIVTTQFLRTKLTAAPTAEAMHLTPIVVATGGPAHADSVAARVRALPRDDVVLVVGHSNTIPAIIAALGGPRLHDLCAEQYATLFVLEMGARDRDGPRLIRATFGAADPPDSDGCARMSGAGLLGNGVAREPLR